MKTIKFTQYLRPNGRAKEILTDVDDILGEKAEKFIEKGGKFEAEVLSTGEISLTAVLNEEDVSIEIVQNGPAVLEAVKNLINSLS